jgi:hypothetical protein
MKNLSEHQIKFTHDICLLVMELKHRNIEVVFEEFKRTPEQQELYFKQGLSKTLLSAHINKLAGDLSLFKDGKYTQEKEIYKIASEIWLELDEHNISGFTWGWDYNHFERMLQPRPVSNLQNIVNPEQHKPKQ